jgi:hypothetical protein
MATPKIGDTARTGPNLGGHFNPTVVIDPIGKRATHRLSC